MLRTLHAEKLRLRKEKNAAEKNASGKRKCIWETKHSWENEIVTSGMVHIRTECE